MVLIFLGVLIVFTVLSFSMSDCLDFIANDEWPQFTRTQSTGLSGLGAVLKSYHKLKEKPKTVLEKVIDNSVKDYRKRLQACVSANGGHLM